MRKAEDLETAISESGVHERIARYGSNHTSVLLRALPYALLIGAIMAVPAYIFKPSSGGSNYYLTVLIYVGINTILAVGLNLLMGYAGQVSLGHAAFYGIGAYTSAILTTQGVPQGTIGPAAAVIAFMVASAAVMILLRTQPGKQAISVAGFVPIAILALHFGFGHWAPYALALACCVLISSLCRISMVKLAGIYVFGVASGFGALKLLDHTLVSAGISPWYAMLVGIAFACLVAYLMGGQTLRLHGHYLAMATLGFGVIVGLVFLHWEPVTGGTSGIYGIPSLEFAGKALDKDVSVYYLVWGIVTAVIALSANIIHSRVGRAFRAVHGSEIAATTLGVDTERYKVQVFVLSAALASIAGSLYAHYVTFISPGPFGFKFSIELVVMVVVGGMASIWGAIFGAGVITILGELLRALSHATTASGSSQLLADLDVVIFGLILVVIMIYLPQGLVRGVVDSVKFASRIGLRKQRKR